MYSIAEARGLLTTAFILSATSFVASAQGLLLTAEDDGGQLGLYLSNARGDISFLACTSPYDPEGVTVFDGGDLIGIGNVLRDVGSRQQELILAKDNDGSLHAYRWSVREAGDPVFIHESSRQKTGKSGSFDRGDGFAVGDLDGDGKAEIVVAEDSVGLVL